MKTNQQSRRNFLISSGLGTAGLLLTFSIPTACSRKLGGSREIQDFNAYLGIGKDGTVRVILSHVEMGQGIWTTLPMLIAEELDCDWKKIIVTHAPPGEPYIHTSYGVQMTGSSSSTYSEFDRYRMAGATARAMLISAAATRLGIDPSNCTTDSGHVLAGDRKIVYGELVEDAGKLTAPEQVSLKDPKDWKYIGTSMKRLDGKVKINGQAEYGLDKDLPGLQIAVVAHPPFFGAKVISYDATECLSINGVSQVVQIPTGLAVLATNFWSAKKGRDVLQVEWDLPVNSVTTTTQFEAYRNLAKSKGIVTQESGNVSEGLATSNTKLEMEYCLPYLAHACMEPMNCTIDFDGQQAEIWAGVQMPMEDRKKASEVLGIPEGQIQLHTLFMGGAFGRRTTFDSDFVVEAAHIAKTVRKPIKLVWTREDDMRAGYYRAAFLHDVKVGLDKNGHPQAWQHRVVGQSIHEQGTPFSAFVKNGIDGTSVEGARNSRYLDHTPHISIELHSTKNEVPVLWWRSVGHSHIAFAMESAIDELAHAAGKDPVAYRRELLDSKRHLATLNLAAEKSGWGKRLPDGHYQGIAVHESFRSYVAHVVEVSLENGKPKVQKVTCAIDCGLAVNPDGVKAQMEGGIIFGLSAALYGEITMDNGSAVQSNFHDYQMVRMSDAPKIEVFIVDSEEQMGGAGEPCVPPVAPALTNAIFAATGTRIRTLPVMTHLIL
ncbi:xanthine dehydrogenase family protein molybdopterin-binding subunit [Allomuricauda sp. NBRC 101325]|uniref:xanthine dehydrogenase family protein molybdopterin-binding subunit n=1 Tax=Allomuricauda sp. NBRC 101325 TaxID=1113758 RepID=UPI002556B386|nr:xanthine dehydrogenase family protein molybdopterin-binding subunit [Muricauda sp. NBRC 101325]